MSKSKLPDTSLTSPVVTGVPSIWDNNIAAGLTPGKVASILQTAATGEADDYLGLAEQLEEMDPHYRSVLQTRKLALESLDFVVEAVSDKPQDQAIADAVRDLLDSYQAEFLVNDLADALGKGFSVVELLWGQVGKVMMPTSFTWCDPRLFLFDAEDGRKLKVKNKQRQAGLDLPPYQFITHVPRLKAGLPLRGGLARTAAWYFLFKNFALKDWVVFAEVYGMPFRVGKYDAAATPEDRSTLLTALRNLGSDGAAAIPESMSIEFIQSAGKSNAEVFHQLAEYCDKQVSKAVLGQTMTTDDGASLAQAKVHNDVRMDILEADAKQLCATLRRDLLIPFIDINFGQQSAYPKLSLPVIEEEDAEKTLATLERAVRLGLKVQATDVGDRLGFAEPDKGGEVLTTLEERMAATARNPVAKHRQQDNPSVEADRIDALLDDLQDQWQALSNPLLAQLMPQIQSAESFEEVQALLDSAWDSMDDRALVLALAEASFKARGLGDATDTP